VAAGAVGEIQIRGPSIAAAYAGDAGDPQPACDEDGWLATRDLGRFDDEGFLYVLGRSDDVIISGGENVHPLEVENVLHSHPAVAEACVAGLPDPHWGTAIAAWVHLRPGAAATAQELRDHVRRALAGFKVPRAIFFVTEFPRTAAGKIARHALRGEDAGGETPR
jgi:acyl-CoA synthetase (AMP-forming)/AMP-acid ligase II